MWCMSGSGGVSAVQWACLSVCCVCVCDCILCACVCVSLCAVSVHVYVSVTMYSVCMCVSMRACVCRGCSCVLGPGGISSLGSWSVWRPVY